VGRGDERAAFRRNLDLAPEDERHRFLVHVHGNAGVGKTFLVRELEQVAREKGALTAYVDESVDSVPEAMSAISRQLVSQGCRFKELERLLAAHRERRHEAEAAALTTRLGDPARQLADLDRAVTLQPDWPWGRCERGDALRNTAASRRPCATTTTCSPSTPTTPPPTRAGAPPWPPWAATRRHSPPSTAPCASTPPTPGPCAAGPRPISPQHAEAVRDRVRGAAGPS
jgi:hypothetical protein